MAVFLGTDAFSPFSCLMAADTTGGLTSDAKEQKDNYMPRLFLTNWAMEKSDKLFEVIFSGVSSLNQLVQVL